jgi:fumarate reductase flavoprotein subunit
MNQTEITLFRLPLLFCCAFLFLSGCSDSGDSDGSGGAPLMNPGTYTGRGSGYGGNISVSALLSETEIENLTILSHHETVSRPAVTQALSAVPHSITGGQTLDVDTITGATATSFGIIDAVEDCVQQAGGENAVHAFGL